LFAFALVYMQKRIRLNNDKILVRRNKAHKMVVKRLKSAEKHLRSNDERAFYDEMLKALWGYMGDKLNLPVARLSKDNVREALAARNAEGRLVDRFVDIAGECEYAQYAPQGSARKEELYGAALELISEFESKI
ncbi:MAG: protein BatD, partial [Rikenellaceae bacterium]|nr:protein BatD [Rikenellaceae bacterium]